MNTEEIESINKYCKIIGHRIRVIEEVLHQTKYPDPRMWASSVILQKSFDENMKTYESFEAFAKELSFLIPDTDCQEHLLELIKNLDEDKNSQRNLQETYFNEKVKIFNRLE